MELKMEKKMQTFLTCPEDKIKKPPKPHNKLLK